MENQKRKIYTTLFLSLLLTIANAQQAITSSGGNSSSSNCSISYSVGQIVYKTISGSSVSLAQGVQQPFEISTVSIKESNEINLLYSAYPNPTSDFLVLKIEDLNKDNLFYQLIDINGKLLESKKITDNNTSISMNGLSAGSYFLKIIERKKEVQSFKIIKN